MPYGGGHDEDAMKRHESRLALKILKLFVAGAAIFFLMFSLTLLIMIMPFLNMVLVVLAILLLLHKSYAAFVKAYGAFYEN